MPDDESDSEAQGIDALRLLKQGSPSLKGVPGTSGETPSGPASVPLVSLLPSQKRSRSLSQDLADQLRPSASQKLPPKGSAAAPSQPSATVSQQRKEREIRHHKSAPEQDLNLVKELRTCRSAPDLTLPALAAIRGLQNGTLQVDRHTRLKIAAAAKRVLEARELKRRASQEQERESHSQHPDSTVDPVSPLALTAQPLWDRPSQSLPAVCEPLSQGQSLEARGVGKGQESGLLRTELPDSIGTAAAIAAGQSPQAGSANFHRPALGVVNQNGALISTTHRPFIVTTGLPRFSLGASGTGEPLQAPIPTWKDAAPQSSAMQLAASKDLSMRDLKDAGKT